MTPLGQTILTEVADWFNAVTNPDEAERLDGALEALRYLAGRLHAAHLLPDDDREYIWVETTAGHMPSRQALTRYVEEEKDGRC